MSLIALIADDAFAASFQTMGQYRVQACKQAEHALSTYREHQP